MFLDMDNVYKIHIASPSELHIIGEMAETVFRQTYRDILSPQQMEYMMDWMYSLPNLVKQVESGHVFHIISDGDTPCGYMSIGYDCAEDGISVFHLHKLYVMPSYQGKGLGKALFDAATGYAQSNRKTPYARMELNVNRDNPAVGFYRKAGMRILRQGDFHIGNGFYMNDYIMGLDL